MIAALRLFRRLSKPPRFPDKRHRLKMAPLALSSPSPQCLLPQYHPFALAHTMHEPHAHASTTHACVLSRDRREKPFLDFLRKAFAGTVRWMLIDGPTSADDRCVCVCLRARSLDGEAPCVLIQEETCSCATSTSARGTHCLLARRVQSSHQVSGHAPTRTGARLGLGGINLTPHPPKLAPNLAQEITVCLWREWRLPRR